MSFFLELTNKIVRFSDFEASEGEQNARNEPSTAVVRRVYVARLKSHFERVLVRKDDYRDEVVGECVDKILEALL